MGEINTSTLKRFLKKTNIRAKPAAIEAFGNKISEYADMLAKKAADKAIADKRKTLFPEDFKLEDIETAEEAAEEDIDEAEDEDEQD